MCCIIYLATVVMGSSWNFPARAKPSRAKLGHFDSRAETDSMYIKFPDFAPITQFRQICSLRSILQITVGQLACLNQTRNTWMTWSIMCRPAVRKQPKNQPLSTEKSEKNWRTPANLSTASSSDATYATPIRGWLMSKKPQNQPSSQKQLSHNINHQTPN